MDYDSMPTIGKYARILGGEGSQLGRIEDSRPAEDGEGREWLIKDGAKDLGWHKTAFLEVTKEH